jgi:hypothetical protein
MTMAVRSIQVAGAIFLAALTAGCAGDNGSGMRGVAEFPPSSRRGTDSEFRNGSIMDIVGGRQIGNARIGNPADQVVTGAVNRHLWQASLDTLGFLPIASTDPFAGVIATDWGTAPDSPGERFKVTAFISDQALTPQSLRVAVFRERLDGGAWVSAPVAEDTPRRLEDAILVRARQLRIAEREAQG